MNSVCKTMPCISRGVYKYTNRLSVEGANGEGGFRVKYPESVWGTRRG